MGAVLTIFSQLEDMGECCVCGVRFGAPTGFVSARRQDKRTFFCPNGHEQSFVRSETDRLRAELECTRERAQKAEEQLARHMAIALPEST